MQGNNLKIFHIVFIITEKIKHCFENSKNCIFTKTNTNKNMQMRPTFHKRTLLETFKAQSLILLSPDISCFEVNVYPDHPASQKSSDQDLHCFPVLS